MERELLILRHGKSSWDSGAPTDHDRPLAKRGRRDAVRMGEWLANSDLVPDCIVASTAMRARQTATRAAEAMGLPEATVRLEERVYGAGIRGLLEVLADAPPDARRVMIVGHNPGFEGLVSYLAGAAASAYEAPKFFPTCSLAIFRAPEDWSSLDPNTVKLIELVRPRTLR